MPLLNSCGNALAYKIRPKEASLQHLPVLLAVQLFQEAPSSAAACAVPRGPMGGECLWTDCLV